ncbi:putative O-glycosylation ligase, exosortase A system-associated [Parahaliea sp. F7430]|uniref:Putative O-glycosylation ligase, exosortase A system-associated n=1 Tax=Sediminihaliea albiluteola TaxID=2758564 RepID=A0A7W2YIN4_9GAMM|nr:putative O-glycosylation ligase, exosortase A system-associated [Sediminihaliea albiluteola]MBA6412701.1 putative O-glycosylation ligase, exosortase A system-associated [Sediminihaliea albiluteola]
MGLRDILVTLLVFGSLPLILWRPYTGILVWSWISYMNPHRLAYGFAYSMPFAQIVALTLMLAMVFSQEKKTFPFNSTTAMWLCFLVWMCFTTALAVYPEAAMLQLVNILKIQLVALFTLVLINDRERLQQLIWVIVASIGFYSVKGGVFTILTGGAFIVWGPDSSYIRENNALAVAILMTIPLMIYLYMCYREQRWIRWLLGLSITLSLVSVIGSQSRGAIVSILAVGGFFWLKSHSKLITGPAIIILAALVFNFMPTSWHERMGTIENYQEDNSALQRLNSWQYSLNVANESIVGAGFSSWSQEMFQRYAPRPEWVFVAHSIYFHPLAEHGWPGLLLFLLILATTWRNLSRVIKNKHKLYHEQDILLARMLQVSLVAYMSGGAFLSLTYFDLPWHLVGITIILWSFGKPELQPDTPKLRRLA